MVFYVYIIHLLSMRLNCSVVYINYHVKTSIPYVPYLNSYLIMGIRLFPGTNNHACLAELINVPDDSFTRIHYIKEQYQGEAKEPGKKWPENDWYEMFRNHIEGDEDLMKAYEFDCSGWGYFNENYLSPDSHCAGKITDPVLARKIFDSAHNKELSNHIDFERVFQLSTVFSYG